MRKNPDKECPLSGLISILIEVKNTCEYSLVAFLSQGVYSYLGIRSL